MKECLHCKKEFSHKRESAKFCSDKCRAAYNRAHPQQSISKFQMQALYNDIKAFFENQTQIKNVLPISPETALALHNSENKDQATITAKQLPPMLPEVLMRKYVDERRECSCEEEFVSWLERLDSDTRLSTRQKQMVKNTN